MGAAVSSRVAVSRRVLLASVIATAVVGGLLLGYYLAGAAEVHTRAERVRQRPYEELAGYAGRVAAELRRDLDELLQRESQRPYYQYGNLYRDPGSTGLGLGVWLSQSPLAAGPVEPLVAEHFQIDDAGAVTLPTLNDDEPGLSNQDRLAEHVAVRERLAAAQSSLRDLVVRDTRVALAEAPGRPEDGQSALPFEGGSDKGSRVVDTAATNVEPPPQAMAMSEGKMGKDVYERGEGQYPGAKPIVKGKPKTKRVPPKVERLDPEVYAQNAEPTAVYRNIVAQQQKQAARPIPTPSANALASLREGRVTIVSSALVWHVATLGERAELLAMRHVETPDGTLVQGMVIDRDALVRWVEDRVEREDEEAPASLALVPWRPGAAESPQAVEVLEPWGLFASPEPAVLATAASLAAGIERAFLWRFFAVAGGAAAAAVFLVWLIAGAERLARERSQFAAAAAHELRTPLAGLQLYGEMLADGLGDPKKARDYARRLSEEAARLGRVVANVLGFSQLERGNLALSVSEGDLAGVLRELVSRTEPTLERAGAFLELEVPASLPARFDRDAVVRIVGNLLDNAEKYGRGAADRAITLAAMAHPDAGVVEVVVTDRGPGISAELGRRLFRPFSRATGSDHPAGLGLGLALSRSLANAMGGELTYRRRGDATEFVLRLPASERGEAKISTGQLPS